MDKLKMHSVDKVREHIEQIRALFPNCVTEAKNDKGETTLSVDFDMLRQELSDVVVEGPKERYQFTWPDKRKSVLAANAPISKTLRPVRADETTPTGFDSNGKPYCSSGSVNFDTTENLYIEGDNLDVLKLLQETYLGKVKMIYIDPPYNTGNDFVYEDDFSESAEDYMTRSGDYDEEGNRLVKNLDSNGRFHTDWLNMIYPRLKLAKDLLTDDGVIFISIDEHEVDNLKKICDEVFGPQNFESLIAWTDEGNGYPRIKIYLRDAEREGQAAINFLTTDRYGSNQEGSAEVEYLFNRKGVFDNPKPVRLLRAFTQIASKQDSIILDFFSGSATTAHAVMQLNAEDGGHRKFIMVQLPEETDEKSEAYKAGYKNICEIGKERIRRAGTKIIQEVTSGKGNLKGEGWGCGMPSTKEEWEYATKNILDVGFRVLKVDSTNMQDVYYNPAAIQQGDLLSLADNIKPDRTAEDLLFQIMLDLGILLSSKIEQTTIGGKTVYSVADGYLLACFDDGVTDEVVTEVAKRMPYYFVMRDSSLANDATAANFDQIFQTYSPTTVRKVL